MGKNEWKIRGKTRKNLTGRWEKNVEKRAGKKGKVDTKIGWKKQQKKHKKMMGKC